MTNRSLPDLLHLMSKVRPLKELPAPEECRQLRLDAGVTANLAGALMGAAQTTVFRYESGTTAPKGAARLRYLRLLGLFEKLRNEHL